MKGFALDDGDYVTVSEEEMAALDPDMARTIDIDEFIDLADIDPIFYDNAYYLVPGDQASKPYKLLANAMEEAEKVGICHFVMRSKRYLAAVRPVDGRLLLSTMVYHDESSTILRSAALICWPILRLTSGNRQWLSS